MSRPVSLDYSKIKEEIEAKGVIVEDINRNSGNLDIYFKCTDCGESYLIRYQKYQKGDNPKFYCKKCQVKHGSKMQRITDYFREKNVEIIEIDDLKKHWKIKFKCSKCGEPGEILDDYLGKSNVELRCKHCLEHCARPTQESVEKLFKDAGSELLSPYINNRIPLKFKCVCCGAVSKITLGHLDINSETSLWCDSCKHGKFELLKVLSDAGSELRGEFKYMNLPVDVSCTKCGNTFGFRFDNFKYSGVNKEIICKDCLLAKRNPLGIRVHGRYNFDGYWYNYVKEFFNLPKCDWENYNSHHINRYIKDTLRQTSICNGYPLLKENHKYLKNSFYHSGEGQFIESWGDDEKLPYHNYPGFRFLDLNSKCVMEILYPEESMSLSELYKKKFDLSKEGIFYFPIFLHEMETIQQRELIYSMLRNRLSKWFPDIYAYSGVNVVKLYARKLKLEVIENLSEVKIFFDLNHIQGFEHAQIYIGLRDFSGNLVCCMSFGRPRVSGKAAYDFELIRYASRQNYFIIGGASKIFSYFVKNYKPKSIISFCDIRFSSINPEETLYPKLGFKFENRSHANYWYRDPYTGIVKSRLNFQKKSLKEKLKKFDPNLSEFENMQMNGFIRICDCGNFRFVWRNENE